MSSKMQYFSEKDVFNYVYSPKDTRGTIELWFESELAKYDAIEWSKHADTRLAERGFDRNDIVKFLTDKTLKIVWRPNYKSNNGLSARITGRLKGEGYITVLTDDDLTEDNELHILTAYKINHSQDDIAIYEEGVELFIDRLEEEEGLEV